MKISLITTVFNEEKSIVKFLDSILIQTKLLDEVIIVDGGSIDRTAKIILKYEAIFKDSGIKFIFNIKKGNRSVGRNEAIKRATNEIIVCSDAGCILDKDWVQNITKPFSNKNIDIVSGYYKGLAKNIFQKCLIPYVLVMPDQVNPKNFLPSARSMAFRKSAVIKFGGYPEKYSDNEDYVLATLLKKEKINFYFQKTAIVYWIPRVNFYEAFIMFYRFAKGDLESGIVRPKVLALFVRYLLGPVILVWNIKILLILLLVYILWAIYKNYKYVKDIRAILILPSLQFTSDLAVVIGTLRGLVKYGIQK